MAREMKAVMMVEDYFRVMDLPPEIRGYVWRFAVVTDHAIEIRDHWASKLVRSLPPSTLRSGKQIKSCRKHDEARFTSILAIALTCRQVYLEVVPIYCSQNVFRLYYYYAGHRSLTVFTSAIGKKKAQSITSAILEVVENDTPDFLCLPGLQRFDIKDFTGWPHVGMGMIDKRALELHENPSPTLTENGSPGCIGSSATRLEHHLNGSRKDVSEKRVEPEIIDSHAVAEE